MKKSKFSEAQVAAALCECASGTPVGQVARRLGVSEQTLYIWKKKYASLDVTDIRRVRQLVEENTKLKGLVADPSLDKVMLQDLLSRNGEPDEEARRPRGAAGQLPRDDAACVQARRAPPQHPAVQEPRSS